MPHREILSEFLTKARSGDGQFAIAYSLLTLATEHRTLQEHLTFNGSSGVPGVLEKSAMVMMDINTTLSAIVDKLPAPD